MSVRSSGTTSTNTPTHLLWCGRWIPAVACEVDLGNGPEEAWEFDDGYDAADWLRWPDTQREDG